MENSDLTLKEISLKEIWQVLIAHKLIITLIVMSFAITSVLIAINLPNMYRSEIKLLPSEDSSSSLSSLAGSLGGLASLAGVNLSGGKQGNTLLAMEMLTSRDFLGKFVNKHNLLVDLIASEGMNEDGELLYNESLYDLKAKKWVRDVHYPKPVVPSVEDIHSRFGELLVLDNNVKTGMLKVNFTFYQPFIAQKWLTLLMQDVNASIKIKDINEARKNIEFLREAVEKTENNAMQESLYQIIEEQMKMLMLAKGRDDYVFNVVDSATLPEVKASPKRAFICISITIFGMLLACMFVLIRHFSVKKS